jgi:hypothetical protein
MELRSGFITPLACSAVEKQPIRSFQKEILAVLKNYQKKNPDGMSKVRNILAFMRSGK